MHIEINPAIRNALKEVFMYDEFCNLLHIQNKLVDAIILKIISNFIKN